MTTVAGVVLAAGLSERMGTPKQLLAYRGGTILGHSLAAAEGSRLDPVVLVLGAAALEVEASLNPTRALIVQNLHYHEGNLSSLRVGVEAAGDVDAVVVLLGDMPEVGSDVIDAVAGAWLEDPKPLAVTEYRDGAGHPLVLGASTLARLDDLRPPKALWRLLDAAPAGDVLRVSVDRDRPVDVDTPEDYERLQR